MKRVLITGAGSYIGERLAAWLRGDGFDVETLSVRGEAWRARSFSGCEAVVHVAGLAHQRETAENAADYDRVNRALAVEVARKAKNDGVPQFVFFSSMSVYGLTVGRIDASTPEHPTTYYGQSKLAAERELAALDGDGFRIATLRPPMIYGKGCKGNYPRLSAMVRRLPAFPRVSNERSMLYIDTLCAFTEALIESGRGGLFFPQNREYVTTDELARQIALAHGKRLWQLRGFGHLLGALAKRGGTIGKVFGTLTYDQTMSAAFETLPQPSFADTIRATEGVS